ncbi:MAG: tetratricopeptide repeat protein, partial [Chloroflexi bacterium]|nr:tetratricopeptide repeat protein [Chloroflexota bacterium]
SPALERAILKALVKDPARRYQSVEALLADLAQPEVAVAVPADAARPVLTFLDQEAPNNLPMLPTSFVGREPEMATIQERLRRPDIRLLTLTGPGGAGKTRLALQAAATLLNEYEHGVFFVNLAPLQDATFLLDTVAHTLGLVQGDVQPLDRQLEAFLRDRHLLLVLDNFEQLIEAAPVIGELLAAAPLCKILATSREPLRLYGENLYQVPPLSLPNLERFPSPGELAQVAAVQLFVARAQAVDPDFSLNPANARDVAELCVRLDGLPLAIELIAAQLYSFPVSELAAQSANRLALLAEGPRDRSARQRTMRGAIDWSYELLAATEQVLFARLGVFAGKFTAEAAGAVVGNHPLATLVQKSLLQQEEDSHGSPRFWMLELLREYALERLAARQETEPLRQKQAAYYLSLAEMAEPHLTGPEQAAWFEQLEAAHDNFRAVLGWALERGMEETALRLAGVLWRLWAVHSHLSEGRRWLEKALARGQHLSPSIRAKALLGAGRLALFQGLHDQARAFLAESLDLYQALNDQSAQADVLNNLGEIGLEQADYSLAGRHFHQALALYRAVDDRAGMVRTLNDLAQMTFWQGQFEEARHFLEECLALERQGGAPEGLAVTLNSLGEVARAQGRYQEAAAFYRESLELYRALNYPIGMAVLYANLGYVELGQENYREAAVLFGRSFSLLRTLEEKVQIAKSLAGLGGATLHLGNAEQAVRFLGAAQALLDSLAGQLEPVEQAAYEGHVAASQASLDPQTWQAAWNEGQSMPLEELLEVALLS